MTQANRRYTSSFDHHNHHPRGPLVAKIVLCHPSQRISCLATRVSVTPLVSRQHFMRVRCILQNVVRLVGFTFTHLDHFLANSLQRLDETIQLFFGSLSVGSTIKSPVNREMTRLERETEVHQTFSNIELGNTIFFIESAAIPDHFMTYTTFDPLNKILNPNFSKDEAR